MMVLSIILIVAMILGAGAKQFPAHTRKKSQACVGFTVIEAGKGVNCYGDTIRLAKTNGYYSAIADSETY